MTLTIAFFTSSLNDRGTGTVVYDYAYYNEKILKNRSIIFYTKNNRFNNNLAIKRFRSQFNVIELDNFEEINTNYDEDMCDILYIIKQGLRKDGLITTKYKCVIHCVYRCNTPHGDVYAAISPWTEGRPGQGHPVVPHIVSLPDHNLNMRKKLNIPNNAIVFGRHGGKDNFNIDYVKKTIKEISSENENIYFLFVNTNKFCSDRHNIIHLPYIGDLDEKVEFINTCDAMIHSQKFGETFGLSVAEFSIRNKPVLTSNQGRGVHIKLLGNRANVYSSPEKLKYFILNFKDIILTKHVNWNMYEEYNPENVMKIFHEVFIRPLI